MASKTSILNQNSQHLLFSLTSKTTPLHFLNFKRKPLLSFSSSTPSSSSQLSCCHIARISTVPVEYAPPAPDFNFYQEISRLKKLRSKLSFSKSLKHKLSVLDADSRVKEFFNHNNNYFARVLSSLNFEGYHLFLIKCLIAAGQEHVLKLGTEFVDLESEVRNHVKGALYTLVKMIESWDINGSNSEAFVKSNDVVLENEQVKDLNKLLKNLTEIEQFYDCIGGIIG